ncbi:MAG: Crp/Fnr family transcriptional regulator [Bacteroidota bacterium]
MIEFFNYLNSLHPLSAEATAALMKVIHAKELRKGQVWLQEGAVCDKLTFVVKGLMKLYFENGNKELIVHFAGNNEFIVSVKSFVNQNASPYTIRAVDPTVICYILERDWVWATQKFPELNAHFGNIFYRICSGYEEHLGLQLIPAKPRYFILMSDKSFLIRSLELPDRLIAAYLGVGPDAICLWKKL